MSEAEAAALSGLEENLSEIVGDDLAQSLVKAALARGEYGLDLHLAINDGLEMLSDDRRRQVLALLDRYGRHC